MADDPIFNPRDHASRLCAEQGWKLGKLLGQGGSAAVFEVSTGTEDAALKVFFPRFIEGREGVVTRKRLAIVKERLTDHNCPTLVQVHIIDEFEAAPFMLMERVSGSMLTDVLRLVPPAAVESIVRQIAEAAKYLEGQGLTHRDIKSDNIIVDAGFTKATLVDVGVARIIDDPVGSGTDDDGQLPFVATARYSSPEYMFRLMSPGPELWRALNFYQLGGLVHDLLAGEPLFEEVVRQASSNRYLIAYAVATKVPRISTRAEVPEYLVALAQRCLLKDPVARLASISWDDFLGRDRLRENEAILGILGNQVAAKAARATDVSELGRAVEAGIDEKLMARSLSCRHSTTVKSRTSVVVKIRWSPPSLGDQEEIQVAIDLEGTDGQVSVLVRSELASSPDKSFDLPAVVVASTEADPALGVAIQAYELFLEASAKLMTSLQKDRAEEAP